MHVEDQLYSLLPPNKRGIVLDRCKKRIASLKEEPTEAAKKRVVLEETISLLREMHVKLLGSIDKLFEDDSNWTPTNLYGYRDVAKIWEHATSKSALSVTEFSE